MPKESAVEIMVFNPHRTPTPPPDQRGVHENLWIKQRFKQYVSIGVYLDGSDLKYYFFENCDKTPKNFYTSLVDLKKELPRELKDIFESTPKLFIMGHGHGGKYGLCNDHTSPSEQIYDENFNKIITDFEKALPKQPAEIFITLEACNTDNLALAAEEGQEKTFLEKLSAKYQNMTFCGTGPWDPKDKETGNRASGGFPTLNAPITAMGGGIWKHGNSVIFYHKKTYQVVVKKSIFASTETAKELKINTIEYAREVLEYAHNVLKLTSLDSDAREKIITKICTNRDVLKIDDLKKIPDFPKGEFKDQETKFVAEEKRILEKEKNNYIARVREILARAKSGEKLTERDLLIIALGLKNPSVFKDHEDIPDKILDKNNKALLSLLMVTCGKVLIAGPSNDAIIDLLLKNGVDINSVDEKGMTALHYAVQNFYNYRKEPLDLINKLLDCGANLEAKDNTKERRTPLMLAREHSRKGTVFAGEKLLELLEQRLTRAVPVDSHTMSSLMTAKLGLFKKKELEDEYLTVPRHDDQLQH